MPEKQRKKKQKDWKCEGKRERIFPVAEQIKKKRKNSEKQKCLGRKCWRRKMRKMQIRWMFTGNGLHKYIQRNKQFLNSPKNVIRSTKRTNPFVTHTRTHGRIWKHIQYTIYTMQAQFEVHIQRRCLFDKIS